MKAPEFWRTGRGGLPAAALSPLGWVYGLAGKVRRSLSRPWQPPVPVICVGNLVAGGAGKTPVALDLAQRLQAIGTSVSFLSRGYGGSETGPRRVDGDVDRADQVGDEPLLLCRQAPTWVSQDRVRGAAAASDGADVIIMDDGYQNPSLIKACSLLVIDGQYGFGNGRLIPAGPLRETPGDALKRADGVIIIGEDEAGLVTFISRAFPDLPLLRTKIVPGPEIKNLTDKPLTAFAGIGQPDKFFRTLTDAGCNVVTSRSFPDHHPYSLTDLEHLKSLAKKNNSQLITTEKDSVRIPKDQSQDIEVLTITLQWEDEALLQSLLDRLL